MWLRGRGGGGTCLLRPPGTMVAPPARTQAPTLIWLPPAWEHLSPLMCSQLHQVPPLSLKGREPSNQGKGKVCEQMLTHSGSHFLGAQQASQQVDATLTSSPLALLAQKGLGAGPGGPSGGWAGSSKPCSCAS